MNLEPDHSIQVHVAMASRDEVDQLLSKSIVCCHYVYKTVWSTFVREICTVSLETADRHAVSLMKSSALCLTRSPNHRGTS